MFRSMLKMKLQRQSIRAAQCMCQNIQNPMTSRESHHGASDLVALLWVLWVLWVLCFRYALPVDDDASGWDRIIGSSLRSGLIEYHGISWNSSNSSAMGALNSWLPSVGNMCNMCLRVSSGSSFGLSSGDLKVHGRNTHANATNGIWYNVRWGNIM